MIHGGLKIFGDGQKGVPAQRPKTLGERAKRVFGKWHGFGAKIKQGGKGIGNYTKQTALAIIRFFVVCKMRKVYGENAFANKTEKKSVPKEEGAALGTFRSLL